MSDVVVDDAIVWRRGMDGGLACYIPRYVLYMDEAVRYTVLYFPGGTSPRVLERWTRRARTNVNVYVCTVPKVLYLLYVRYVRPAQVPIPVGVSTMLTQFSSFLPVSVVK